MQTMKIAIKAVLCVVFACTMIPSLVWPDRTPAVVKGTAFGVLVLGIILTLRERFKMWNELSRKTKEHKPSDR
jgi:hypothetical protein